MSSAGPKTSQKRLLAGIGILLLLVIVGTVLYNLGRRSGASEAEKTLAVTPKPEMSEASNAVPSQVAGVQTNAPGSLTGPGVAELLQLMQTWRQQHPNYRVTVETTGPDLASTTEVFRFVGGQGTVVSRMKTQMRQPISLDFIMEAKGEQVRAYFPSMDEVATIDPQQETARFLTQIGWAGGPLDTTFPIKLARASFVESGPDYRALTMVFPGALFKMPRAAGDLFLTIQLDEHGKALSMEQLTLGMRVVSKLTYSDEDPGRIQEASPKIPATAAATKKSFREILQGQWNLSRPSPAKPI